MFVSSSFSLSHMLILFKQNYNSRSFGDVTSTVPLEIVPNSAGMAWEQYKDVGNEFVRSPFSAFPDFLCFFPS